MSQNGGIFWLFAYIYSYKFLRIYKIICFEYFFFNFQLKSLNLHCICKSIIKNGDVFFFFGYFWFFIPCFFLLKTRRRLSQVNLIVWEFFWEFEIRQRLFATNTMISSMKGKQLVDQVYIYFLLWSADPYSQRVPEHVRIWQRFISKNEKWQVTIQKFRKIYKL